VSAVAAYCARSAKREARSAKREAVGHYIIHKLIPQFAIELAVKTTKEFNIKIYD